MLNNGWNLQTIEDYSKKLADTEKERSLLATKTAELQLLINNQKKHICALQRENNDLQEELKRQATSSSQSELISIKLDNIKLRTKLHDLEAMRDEVRSTSADSLD